MGNQSDGRRQRLHLRFLDLMERVGPQGKDPYGKGRRGVVQQGSERGRGDYKGGGSDERKRRRVEEDRPFAGGWRREAPGRRRKIWASGPVKEKLKWLVPLGGLQNKRKRWGPL